MESHQKKEEINHQRHKDRYNSIEKQIELIKNKDLIKNPKNIYNIIKDKNCDREK